MDLSVPDKRGKIQTMKLSDGYTLLMIAKPAIAGLGEALEKAKVAGLRYKITSLRKGASEIRLVLPDPIKSFKVTRARRKVKIVVEYQRRASNLRDRIEARLFVPVPSSFVAGRFSAAERLMRRGNLEDALANYKELSEEYALRAWSQLRLSDIALLSGNTRGACRRYERVAESYRVQVSGMLAQLRRQVLGCGWRPEDKPDWDVMLERADRVRGQIGNYIREEAIWAMNQVATPDEVDLTLRLMDGVAVKHRMLKREIKRSANVLLSRGVRLPAEQLDVARVCYRHRERILVHPDGLSLRLLCAKAFLELDLVDEAIAETKEIIAKTPRKFAGAMWAKRDGTAQATIFLARAYKQTGDADYVYATLVKYQRKFGRYIPEEVGTPEDMEPLTLDDLDVGRKVNSVDKRIKAVSRAITAEVSGR
jgi:tetratricopeptide (TPR) repeat protein